jgi:membrane-associated phospholipid phosphatase
MNKRIISCLILLFATAEAQAQNPDINLLRQLNLHRNRSLDGLLIAITESAAPLAYSLPLALLLIALWKRRIALRQKAVCIIQSALVSLLLSTLIKNIVHRTRPFITYPELEKLSTGGSGSFPSGHTADAFTLAASLSLAFPRWWVVGPAFAWAATVGYSRMHLGVHYPTDVAASMILGIACAFVVYKVRARRRGKAIVDHTTA